MLTFEQICADSKFLSICIKTIELKPAKYSYIFESLY